jgi:hyperosmotically inducible periplasmic protein
MVKNALLIAVVLCVAAPAAAAQDRSDAQILREISESVNRYTQLTIFDALEAGVADGHVALTGWVTMPYKKTDLETRVRSIAGVTSLDNRIEVLPVSQLDDELRFRIARAIYGHSAFWNYAAMANPPIHIIVNGGRVTLHGVVQSNVERQLARSLATGFGSFEVKNELKTGEELRTKN